MKKLPLNRAQSGGLQGPTDSREGGCNIWLSLRSNGGAWWTDLESLVRSSMTAKARLANNMDTDMHTYGLLRALHTDTDIHIYGLYGLMRTQTYIP